MTGGVALLRGCLVVAVATVGCSGRDAPPGTNKSAAEVSGTMRAPAVLPPSPANARVDAGAGLQFTRAPAAEARLAALLEASLATSPPQEVDTLMACPIESQAETYATLARYRVLGSQLRGDTVHASAEIVTVAKETGDPHSASRFVTTVRTETDTLHWVMVRDTDTGLWGACGYPAEGVGFGHLADDQQTRWVPAHFSWSRVKQLAESVHARR